MKNLVIVESPAKAKTISKFLGKDYKVVSSYGHIRDLKKKGLGINLKNNFNPLYEVPQDKAKLVDELKKDVSIAIVTHNMQQASRISDYTAFMYLGDLVEYDKTENIFLNPKEKRTEDYITGRFG